MNSTGTTRIEIPMKLPSLNDYIRTCRSNAYAGAKMKKEIQQLIEWYLIKMPVYTKPIYIHFHWVEVNHKRDLDNISYGKKFILDAMQELGKIPNDNTDYIKGFTDTFSYEKQNKIIIEITEANNDTN